MRRSPFEKQSSIMAAPATTGVLMRLGLETFSYYLAFAAGKMDIFDFIHKAEKLGLDGVQINIEGDDLGHLADDSPGHLQRVRALCNQLGLYIDLDASGTDPVQLYRYLDICTALGVDRLRTYSSFGGDVRREMTKAISDLNAVVPAFARAGVRIAYENHEYESSHDVLEVIAAVGSPVVGAHIDTGNSMMLWEDPITAVRNMAPEVVSTHFKDHLVIDLDGTPMIVGVPLGTGTIDLDTCYCILSRKTGLDRINIEVCYGYAAPFRVDGSDGLGATLGEGAFKVSKPPFDPQVVAPHLLRPKADGFKSYAWQELVNLVDEDEMAQLIGWQAQAVETSVRTVQGLRRRWA
jgi:sugar phosphate isomerase/epimerase